jgi:hypothetical protein
VTEIGPTSSLSIQQLLITAPERVALVSNLTGGVNRALTGTSWVAFKFTMSGTQMSEAMFMIGKDVATVTGQISMYLYTDNAGVPGTDISSTDPGQPHTYYYSGFSNAYVPLYFKQLQAALTDATPYWLVIKGTGITGGNVYFDSQASGSNKIATASDSSGVPGAWTGAAFEGVFSIYQSPGYVLLVNTNSGVPVFGNAATGDGVEGKSLTGFGGKFISTFNVGVGGFSQDSVGLTGSSTNYLGLQAVSVNGPAAAQLWGQGATSIGVQVISQSTVGLQAISYVGLPIACLDPSGNFSGWSLVAITEEITLSTVGLITNSVSSIILPANSVIDCVSWRVSAAITTATVVSLGDATTAARFGTITPLTLGSTGVGLPTTANQAANAAIRITCNIIPGAGKVRVVTWARVFTPPSF